MTRAEPKPTSPNASIASTAVGVAVNAVDGGAATATGVAANAVNAGDGARGGGARRMLLFGAGPMPGPDETGAPGVANRLWHFLRPALEAGHRALAVTLEPGAPPLADASRPRPCRAGDLAWEAVAAPVEDFKRPAALARLARAFAPDAVAGVGTLQAAATACAVVGDRPVWADLFGDPLAEIQAKASLLGGAADPDEHLFVWELMTRVLQRADAFSTVSRRQRDALLGQLLLMGMTDGQVAADPGRHPAAAPTLEGLVHCMPCGLAGFRSPRPAPDAPARARWRSERGLPADARVALWSGGFNAWADPATLVAAVERAMNDDPRLWLVATGGGLPGYLNGVHGEARRLAAASRHAGRMRLEGWLRLEEAEGWAAMADVALLADRPCAETRLGARNRLLTLAVARCPIAATLGTEVVEEMAAGGALRAVPAGDAEALAMAIDALLADPKAARAQAERAIDFCERHYRFDATAGPFLRFIEAAGAPAGADAAANASAGGGTDAKTRSGIGAATGDDERGSAPGGSGLENRLDSVDHGQASDPASAAEVIADCLDLDRRRAELAELARYRAGRLHRLRHWIRRLGSEIPKRPPTP
jgi:glycosyltransferase involved in cell wall biosynthesis